MGLTNVKDGNKNIGFLGARWLSYANGIFLEIELGDSFEVYALKVFARAPAFPEQLNC